MTTKATSKINLHTVIKKVIVFLPIGLAINLAFSYYIADAKIAVLFANFPYIYLIIAMILGIIPWFTHALRMLIWARLLKENVSFWTLLQSVLGCELGTGISPTAIGGGPVKFAMLVQRGVTPGGALTLTTTGTIEDGVFFLTMVPIALSVSSAWQLLNFSGFVNTITSSILTILVIVVMVMLLGFLLIKSSEAIKQFSKRVWLTIKDKVLHVLIDTKSAYTIIIQRGKLRFILALVLTAVHWFSQYAIIFVLLKSLGIAFDPFLFFALQWLVATISVFIPTPGATGGAELSFFILFKNLIPRDALALTITGWRLLTFYLLQILGIIVFSAMLFRENHARDQRKKQTLLEQADPAMILTE